jgi:hypothetical protein
VKKNHKKIKTNHMEKNCCNPQCFQGKNYKSKFSIRLILKKIKLTDNFGKNRNKKNERKKNMQRNTIAIYNVS